MKEKSIEKFRNVEEEKVIPNRDRTPLKPQGKRSSQRTRRGETKAGATTSKEENGDCSDEQYDKEDRKRGSRSMRRASLEHVRR
jgi:hypothetical protein